MARAFNQTGLLPEEFLRLVSQEDTLSQSLQRRAASPTPPYITIRIIDPWCYAHVALAPYLKEFITKDRVTKAPTLEVRVIAGDPGGGNKKSQSFSSSADNTHPPQSDDPPPSKIETTSFPFKPIPLSSNLTPLT